MTILECSTVDILMGIGVMSMFLAMAALPIAAAIVIVADSLNGR